MVEWGAGGQEWLSPSCQGQDKKPLSSEQTPPIPLSHPHTPFSHHQCKWSNRPSPPRPRLRDGYFPREFHSGRRLCPQVVGLLFLLLFLLGYSLPWLRQSHSCFSFPPWGREIGNNYAPFASFRNWLETQKVVLSYCHYTMTALMMQSHYISQTKLIIYSLLFLCKWMRSHLQ